MTTMISAANFGNQLLETIRSKDARKSLIEIQQFKEKMQDKIVGADFVTWISEPVNLTTVHKAIADDLQVPPRAMAIKRVMMTRPQRAFLLVQAMELAIKRVHGL